MPIGIYGMTCFRFPFRRFTDGSKALGNFVQNYGGIALVSIQTLHRWKQSFPTSLWNKPLNWFPFRRFTDGSKDFCFLTGDVLGDLRFPFRRFTDGSKVLGATSDVSLVQSFHSDASQMEAKVCILE